MQRQQRREQQPEPDRLPPSARHQPERYREQRDDKVGCAPRRQTRLLGEQRVGHQPCLKYRVGDEQYEQSPEIVALAEIVGAQIAPARGHIVGQRGGRSSPMVIVGSALVQEHPLPGAQQPVQARGAVGQRQPEQGTPA